jgi:Fe-S-cluster containining protein
MIAPNEVEAKALKFEEQNLKFRTFLKNRADDDELDAQFLRLHKELFAGYDCRKCNNCCKACKTLLDIDEVRRISTFLGLAESAFVAEYLTDAEPQDEKPYRIKESPCTFLGEDGCCSIQDCKPAVCRDFPYTDQPDRLSSMYSVLAFAEVCPIVFEIIERLKKMYRFR